METRKFCQICFDTGKSESLYTSHFMNEVCPKFLSLSNVCMNCRDCGTADASCTRVLNLRTCTFCSQICLREYAYEWCEDHDDDNKNKKHRRKSFGRKVSWSEK
jgi:hypothetical protein